MGPAKGRNGSARYNRSVPRGKTQEEQLNETTNHLADRCHGAHRRGLAEARDRNHRRDRHRSHRNHRSDRTTEPKPHSNRNHQATEGDLLSAIEEEGVLTVSTDPAYPPQSSLNEETGEYEGFDIDVATAIAEQIGVEVAWEAPAWETIIAGNWNDRWDLSVGSMTITPEREEVLHFSTPYYYTPAVVAVAADDDSITDLTTDLDGQTIGVCGGCTYDFYLQGNLEIPGRVRVRDRRRRDHDNRHGHHRHRATGPGPGGGRDVVGDDDPGCDRRRLPDQGRRATPCSTSPWRRRSTPVPR